MRTSTLIKKLEKIIHQYGDIDVKCWPYDGQEQPKPLKKVAATKTGNNKKIFVEIDA